jgi:hypothetical protein
MEESGEKGEREERGERGERWKRGKRAGRERDQRMNERKFVSKSSEINYMKLLSGANHSSVSCAPLHLTDSGLSKENGALLS